MKKYRLISLLCLFLALGDNLLVSAICVVLFIVFAFKGGLISLED